MVKHNRDISPELTPDLKDFQRFNANFSVFLEVKGTGIEHQRPIKLDVLVKFAVRLLDFLSKHLRPFIRQEVKGVQQNCLGIRHFPRVAPQTSTRKIAYTIAGKKVRGLQRL